MDVRALVHASLTQEASQLGYGFDEVDGRVQVVPGAIFVQYAESEFPDTDSGCQISLTLKAVLGPEPLETLENTVIDRMDGVGATAEEAISFAVHTWMKGVLPALCALCGQKPPEGSVFTSTSVHHRLANAVVDWDVFLGPIELGSDVDFALSQRIEAQHPVDLVLDRVLPMLDPHRPHWMRIYHCRREHGLLASNCQIDNRDFAEGRGALFDFPWPNSTEEQWFRQFVTLIPHYALVHASPSVAVAAIEEEKPWWKKLIELGNQDLLKRS